MFHFKQFAVDQSGCAMKINTDGVLLGALANANEPKQILDIGTGTGVIALMLAQRFENALIDAVEIDQHAAKTAKRNFAASNYHDRLSCYALSFEEFAENNPDKKYDLIVSNPPFYINSLKSPGEQRGRAKHADVQFFDTLVNTVKKQLTANGVLWLVLPLATASFVNDIALNAGLYANELIKIASYPGSDPHRQIIAFSLTESYLTPGKFVIYQSPKIYTEQYRTTLKEFFTIF